MHSARRGGCQTGGWDWDAGRSGSARMTRVSSSNPDRVAGLPGMTAPEPPEERLGPRVQDAAWNRSRFRRNFPSGDPAGAEPWHEPRYRNVDREGLQHVRKVMHAA